MSTARKTLPAVLLLMLVVSFSSFSSFADVVDAAAETHLESSVAAISHQDSSAKIPPTGVNTGAQLFSVFMGLMLILGLILALAWVARRINGGGLMRQGPMKIVASMPLGTRERMMVVEVGESSC